MLVQALGSRQMVLLNDCGEVHLQGWGCMSRSCWENDEEPDDHITPLLDFLPFREDREEVQVPLVTGGFRRLQVYSVSEVRQAMRDVLVFLASGGVERRVVELQEHQQTFPRASTFVPDPEQFRQFALFLGRSRQVLFG